jgi:hypothetical protein
VVSGGLNQAPPGAIMCAAAGYSGNAVSEKWRRAAVGSPYCGAPPMEEEANESPRLLGPSQELAASLEISAIGSGRRSAIAYPSQKAYSVPRPLIELRWT